MQVQVVDYRAPDAAVKFTRSLHETGFGVLTNHPIRQALVEKIYADWLAFFNGDGKDAYAFSKETQDGWFSTQISETAKGSTQKDLKEYSSTMSFGGGFLIRHSSCSWVRVKLRSSGWSFAI